jgi:hypothetical protein
MDGMVSHTTNTALPNGHGDCITGYITKNEMRQVFSSEGIVAPHTKQPLRPKGEREQAGGLW